MEIKGFVLNNISPIRNGKIRRIFFINGLTSRDVHVLKNPSRKTCHNKSSRKFILAKIDHEAINFLVFVLKFYNFVPISGHIMLKNAIYYITRVEKELFTAYFPTILGFVSFAACQ
jgi:hypothetical protein